MSNQQPKGQRIPLEKLGYVRMADDSYQTAPGSRRLGSISDDERYLSLDPLAFWALLANIADVSVPATAQGFIDLLGALDADISLPEDSAADNISLLQALRQGTADNLVHALAGMRGAIVVPASKIWPDLAPKEEGQP